MTDTTLGGWGLDLPSRGAGSRVLGQMSRNIIVTALCTGAFGAAATMIALALQGRPAEPAPAAVPAPSHPPLVWRDIVKPVRIYDFQAPAFAGAALTYAARRHEPTGGREDLLVLGRLDGARPGIRLRMFRRAGEAPDRAPLFAAAAREAAQAGLGVVRGGLPGRLTTRFGAFDIVDVELAPPGSATSDVAAPLPCKAFRLSLEAPALSISGLACGARGAPLSTATAGCLIERLDVASARDDRELVDVFAASELRRNAACAGSRLAPDTRHAAWLDETDTADGGDKVATSRRSLRRR